MASELKLQEALEQLLGNENVYFQPPSSVKLSYDCIVYRLSKIDLKNADNKKYAKFHAYTVTLITKDPDNPLIDAILDAFKHISFDRAYVSDNLHHYVYNLYF